MLDLQGRVVLTETGDGSLHAGKSFKSIGGYTVTYLDKCVSDGWPTVIASALGMEAGGRGVKQIDCERAAEYALAVTLIRARRMPYAECMSSYPAGWQTVLSEINSCEATVYIG